MIYLAESLQGDLVNLSRQFLSSIGPRGVMSLLRLRHTVGSEIILPPDLEHMLYSFRKRNTPGTSNLLSVGARALSKHFLRSQKDQFWGDGQVSIFI